MIRPYAIAILCTIMPASLQAQSTAVVINGDTLEQDGITYRIHGIDAPEYGQTCGSLPCGKLAIEAMAVLAEGKRLTCEALEQDIYRLTIGAAPITWAMRRK